MTERISMILIAIIFGVIFTVGMVVMARFALFANRKREEKKRDKTSDTE